MESPTYEIAFVGRVSAGKSSLLNKVIGVDLLPTGVTPVTAVPTRIKNGSASEFRVWTADGKVNQFKIHRLPDFVTEAGNPSNEKHVTRVLTRIPLSMLPDGVILVDTPGLGSVALEAGSEALAYLPRCDLGVVFVDASSNLQADDVGTVNALRAVGIPALLVLGKIDVLTESDRQRLLDYTRTQLTHQLGVEIQVSALSTRPESHASTSHLGRTADRDWYAGASSARNGRCSTPRLVTVHNIGSRSRN